MTEHLLPYLWAGLCVDGGGQFDGHALLDEAVSEREGEGRRAVGFVLPLVVVKVKVLVSEVTRNDTFWNLLLPSL